MQKEIEYDDCMMTMERLYDRFQYARFRLPLFLHTLLIIIRRISFVKCRLKPRIESTFVDIRYFKGKYGCKVKRKRMSRVATAFAKFRTKIYLLFVIILRSEI